MCGEFCYSISLVVITIILSTHVHIILMPSPAGLPSSTGLMNTRQHAFCMLGYLGYDDGDDDDANNVIYVFAFTIRIHIKSSSCIIC